MKLRVGPNGAHIFDRMSGLNVLLDELIMEKDTWSMAPRQVSIALTNACDLRCSYCYAPKHKASLNTEQVISWLKELDAEGCLGVGFGGGEPMLHPDFVNICRRAAQETLLAITFTTHGHRLTPRIVKVLKGSVHFVRISVDGVNLTYESQRGKPFSNLLQSMDWIADLSPFGINVVVNKRTVWELDAIAELAQMFGASELLLLPQQKTENVEGIDRTITLELHSWVSRYRGNVRLAVSEAGALGLPVCDPLPDETGLRAYAHIDASSMLRASSYATAGSKIEADGVMSALKRLRSTFVVKKSMKK